jgi:hypothetical protein
MALVIAGLAAVVTLSRRPSPGAAPADAPGDPVLLPET